MMLLRLLKIAFFALVARPIVLVLIGLNVRNRARLPGFGPAIVAANHNSHLDTIVLMALFPLRLVHRVRPLAAADYFLDRGGLTWFVRNILGIIPIERTQAAGALPARDVLAEAEAAMRRGDILIVFPEGTRGEPEQVAAFKSGVARLVERVPETVVTPVFMHGLGKVLPKGAWLPVPFFCDIFVGEPQHWPGDVRSFMQALTRSFKSLQDEGHFPPWE